MTRWSMTVLIECDSIGQAQNIRTEMLHEGSRYLTPAEGQVMASDLMTEAEVH